jgi:hypothetical protein
VCVEYAIVISVTVLEVRQSIAVTVYGAVRAHISVQAMVPWICIDFVQGIVVIVVILMLILTVVETIVVVVHIQAVADAVPFWPLAVGGDLDIVREDVDMIIIGIIVAAKRVIVLTVEAAIAVVVGIGIVADTISIVVGKLSIIRWKGIKCIRDRVPVAVRGGAWAPYGGHIRVVGRRINDIFIKIIVSVEGLEITAPPRACP